MGPPRVGPRRRRRPSRGTAAAQAATTAAVAMGMVVVVVTAAGRVAPAAAQGMADPGGPRISPVFDELTLCDTVHPVARDGRRGFALARVTGAGESRQEVTTFLPHGDGTCASALSIAALPSDPASVVANGTLITPPEMPTSRLLLGIAPQPRSWLLVTTTTNPLPKEANTSGEVGPREDGADGDSNGGKGDSGGPTLAQARSMGLALYRNTVVTRLLRSTGQYDVLTVSTARAGLCRDDRCSAVDAVSTVGPLGPDGDAAPGVATSPTETLVSWTDANGATRPVSVADDALLSLGVGGWEADTRFGRAGGPWRAAYAVSERQAGGDSVSEGFPTPLLGRLTSLLCDTRAGAFVSSAADACDGARPPPPPLRLPPVTPSPPLPPGAAAATPPPGAIVETAVGRVAARASPSGGGGGAPPVGRALSVDEPFETRINGRVVASTEGGSDGGAGDIERYGADHAFWVGRSLGGGAVAVEPCAWGTATAAASTRPSWLAGRGSREINADSPAERALAAALTTCTLAIPQQWPADSPPTLGTDSLADAAAALNDDVRAAAEALRDEYDPGLFGQKVAPEEAASNADLVLAILVIIPEAVALVTLSLTTDVWSCVHVAAFVLIATSGFVSLSGIAALYAIERAGAVWSAALLRVDRALLVGPSIAAAARQTGSALRLAGVRQVVTSSTMVVVRVSYRPALLLGLTIGLSVGYTVLAAALLVVSACRWRGRRDRPGSPSAGGAPASAAAAPAVAVGGTRGVGLWRRRGPATAAPAADEPRSNWWTDEEAAPPTWQVPSPGA